MRVPFSSLHRFSPPSSFLLTVLAEKAMLSASPTSLPQPKPTRAALDLQQVAYTSDEQRQAVAGLIDEFTLRPSTLGAIKDHFILELKKGLRKDGETVAMVPVFVSGRLDGSGT